METKNKTHIYDDINRGNVQDRERTAGLSCRSVVLARFRKDGDKRGQKNRQGKTRKYTRKYENMNFFVQEGKHDLLLSVRVSSNRQVVGSSSSSSVSEEKRRQNEDGR